MAYRSLPQYLLNPVFNTPEIKDAMDSFMATRPDIAELAESTLLHHYTTLDGMRGIIKDRALWYSHVSSLNDPLEIQHGQKIVTEVLNDAMKQENREDLRAFLRNMLVHIQAFGTILFHPFIACFCKSGNLLSQWRGYADRGGGYCLGFEFSSATRFTSDLERLGDGKPPFLRKVIYIEQQQRELVQTYVDSAVEGAKMALDGGVASQYSDPPTVTAVMASQAVNVLLDMLLSFKHSAFQEENEWRLVRITREDHEPEHLQFRETAGGLAPYRPTHIYNMRDAGHFQFPLRSISFGPTLEPLRTRSAIELLLHHIAADQHPIALSPHVEVKGTGYSLR